MGDDFRNRQCFVGDQDIQATRSLIVQTIVTAVASNGYEQVDSEDEATRSIVIGPAGRWIFIGDSTGSTEDADPIAFEELSISLSKVIPLIDINMSDSAAIHLSLYKSGCLIDKYGNAAFPFYKFTTPQEAREYLGNPVLWEEYIGHRKPNELRSVWIQDWGADSILSASAEIFGWDKDLARIGYTRDLDGEGMKYDEYLELKNYQDFSELHFNK